jgi:hypothetical protein
VFGVQALLRFEGSERERVGFLVCKLYRLLFFVEFRSLAFTRVCVCVCMKNADECFSSETNTLQNKYMIF